MTLPQNVADALGELDAAHDQRFAPWRNQWQTIRAHLMSQEAEISDLIGKRDFLLRHYNLAESRLAAANALLRELLGAKWCTHEYVDVCNRSATHLQGAGDEA